MRPIEQIPNGENATVQELEVAMEAAPNITIYSLETSGFFLNAPNLTLDSPTRFMRLQFD